MSPNRRGVIVVEEKVVDKKNGEKEKVAKRTVAKNKLVKKKVAETGKKTSPSVTCVRNLGNSPRVPGVRVVANGGKSLPTQRDERRTRPTHLRIMSLLSMAVVPEERSAFRRRFRNARKVGDSGCHDFLCQTPIAVIAKAFGCEPFRLCSAADMFLESRLQTEFLNEFYVMDVILNRAPSPAMLSGYGKGVKRSDDCDAVCPVLSCNPEDVGPGMDYFYRAAILFLPQCGNFYCHRDRHVGDAGVPGTLRAYDMSWLRLQREEGARQHDFPSYTFGSDSFVRRFYSDQCLGDNRRSVSAWRISVGHTLASQQNRVIYRAIQCRDSELPALPPDFISGVDLRSVPPDYRAHQFRNELKTSNSVRFDCRHYVDGSHHYDLPESCWIIDPDDTHFVDVHVVVDGIPNRESVVAIRNVTKIDECDDCLALLRRLTLRCRQIRASGAKGTAQAKSSDVGSMFALGTRIEMKESDAGLAAHCKIPYAANGCVADGVLRGLVADLAIIGSRCFPLVYSVIRDTEGNSGLSPVSPMEGVALPPAIVGGGDSNVDNNNNYHDDDDDDNDDNDDNNNNNNNHDNVREKLRMRMEKLERRQRVGYTIDMSVNLGNSSHFDVNDASQGYSLWTEEMLGRGKNWFFVLPNVHGLRPDGRTKFSGMAVKLGHGVAISWDGRVIRHCTSVSCPDGMEFGYVTKGRDSSFRNHLYGTFTAAKEKIVKAGRATCAAGYRPGVPTSVDVKKACKKRQNKRRRRPRRGRARVGADGAVTTKPAVPAVNLSSGERTVGLPAVELPLNSGGTCGERQFRFSKRRCGDVGDYPSHADGRKDGAGGCMLQSCSRQQELAVGARTPRVGVEDGRKEERPPGGGGLTFGSRQVQLADLEVGGRYKIPKKQKPLTS